MLWPIKKILDPMRWTHPCLTAYDCLKKHVGTKLKGRALMAQIQTCTGLSHIVKQDIQSCEVIGIDIA